ncbi:MAG TPA: beta-propeller fold lactonase family protein, partial [Phnomibacter sp.]|nr:beta-propeller fold lactonase family protein [Phnomibacter sp.]
MKELKVLKAGYYVKYLMLASIFTFKGWLIMAQPNLYIGTYTGSGSYGIYTAFFNAQNGSITLLDSAKAHNPSYLAVDARRQMLYAVAEDAGTNPGAVGAFKIVGNSLQFINQQPSGGDHPCYVAVHPNGKLIAVANYSGGNFSILPVQGLKGVGSKGQTITHQGNGPNAQRQEKPHVHSTIFSPDGKYLLVADLGTDMVTAYPIPKTSKAKLVEAGAFSVQVAPGAGPRHLAFHPKLPIVYL